MIVRERPAPGQGAGRTADASRDEGTAARRWVDPALATVLVALPVAGLTELVLLRTFYRVGIYIPRTGPFRLVYAALTHVGSFALNLASVLAAVALVLLAVRALDRGRTNASLAIGAFLASAAVVRIAGVERLGPVARLTFALAVVAISAPFLRGRAQVTLRALVGVVAACFLLSSYSGLAADGARIASEAWAGGVRAQLLAESLVVLAGLLALAAWIATDQPRPRPLVVAAPLAGTLVAAWWANGAVTGILVLWTVGLRMFLPLWLYALAAWAFLAAAIGWFPRDRDRSAGLILLVISGMLLGSTYSQAIGLVALALLADSRAPSRFMDEDRAGAGEHRDRYSARNRPAG